MKKSFAIVITSLLKTEKSIREFSEKCNDGRYQLFVIGDKKSPGKLDIENCIYYSIRLQKNLSYKYVSKCPVNNYARKNIGYLEAIRAGFECIVETDDDNYPLKTFWDNRVPRHRAFHIKDKGWINIYAYYTNKKVWPRGFPLEKVGGPQPALDSNLKSADCPIQQGLVDGEPDVDAVYRMTIGKRVKFKKDLKFVLGKNSWAPFNSQNTTWFHKAFPLLYLPSYCSMRLCDIWRSLIAQRIAWTCGWKILFHGPNAYQERNEHDLISDFNEELQGYINNNKIIDALAELDLKTGRDNINENILRCYKMMIRNNWIGKKELNLVELWLSDLDSIN